MQRVRVGATGLAAVMLTILVATAVATGVRNGADNTAVSIGNAATIGNGSDTPEPLAQLGAAPAPDKAEPPAAR